MIEGYQVSQVVATVARLGVVDHLESGPMSGAELAQITGANPNALPRLLRLGASAGVLIEGKRARFSLTPVVQCLRRDNLDGSFRDVELVRVGHGSREVAGSPSHRRIRIAGARVPACPGCGERRPPVTFATSSRSGCVTSALLGSRTPWWRVRAARPLQTLDRRESSLCVDDSVTAIDPATA